MNLFEAFDKLAALDEEVFDVTQDGVESLKEFMEEDVTDDLIDVYDVEYDEDEDCDCECRDDHKDNVILDCSVCHSKVYKKKSDVRLDEEADVANIDDECPYCHSNDGYKVVGQIAECDMKKETKSRKEKHLHAEKDESLKEGIFDKKKTNKKSGTKSNGNEYCIVAKDKDGWKYLDQSKTYSSMGDGRKDLTTQKRSGASDDYRLVSVSEAEKLVGKKLNESTGKTIDRAKLVGRHRNKKVSENIVEETVGNELDKYQRWVDYDMKKYKKVSEKTNSEIKKAGLELVKDQYGDYQVIAGDTKDTDESLKEGVSDKNSQVIVIPASINKYNCTNGVLEKEIKKLANEYFGGNVIKKVSSDISYGDARIWVDDKISAEEQSDFVEWVTDKLDDFGTNLKSADESLKESKLAKRAFARKIYEALEDIEVNTDEQRIVVSSDEDGKVTVTTEPKESHDDVEEVIEPVSPETEMEISGEFEDVVEEPSDDVEFEEEEIDEFDEESFDDVAESYLKRIDENVSSYKTKVVSKIGKKNKYVVEGIIRYNDKSRKLTKFMFESKKEKLGKHFTMVGENFDLANKSKKAYRLFNKVENNKIITEGFMYRYSKKDNVGKTSLFEGYIKSTNK